MARGVMFALSFVFLSALLIILSVFFFRAALTSEERATEISLMSRLYDLDRSLQTIIRTTYLLTNDYTFTASNRTISISQTFPLTNAAALTTSLTRLQQFVEADDPAIRFTLQPFITQPYSIMPYAVNYSHPADNQTIIITPSTQNYNAYTFFFRTIQKPLGTVTWTDFDPGSFPITIITGNSTIGQQTTTQLVDLTQDVDIRVAGIPSGEIRISIANTIVTITTNIPVPVIANTSITFYGKEQPRLYSPPFYTIAFPAFNLTKTSGVQLTA